jgi:hypothetical protein
MLGFCLLPPWPMVAASLQPEVELFANRWIPRHPTLANHRLLLSGSYRVGLAVPTAGLLSAAGPGVDLGDGRARCGAAQGTGQLTRGAEADTEPVRHPGRAGGDLDPAAVGGA